MSLYKAIHPVRFRNQQYEPGDVFSAPSGRMGGLVRRGVVEAVDIAEERTKPEKPIEKAVKPDG